MIIENEYLLAEISNHGAEMTRLYDKKRGMELLWNADGTYWKRSAPVLFPIVGRVYGNVMRLPEGEYPFGQHGFARDSEFVPIEQSADAASFVLRADRDTMMRYPFDFALTIGYRLQDRTLEVSWQVENHSQERMPFTIGAHPAFALDECRGRKEDFCLLFPGKDRLEHLLLDPSCGCAVTDKIYELALSDHILPLTEELFTHDALVLDHGQISEAWLCTADGRRIVGIASPGFPNYGIWSVKNAPFVCLEPWIGRTDDVGYTGMMADKPGATVLDPGARFEAAYTILAGE